MDGVLEHCSGLVDRAFCIDYRLASAPPFASANPFPVPLIDALSGYNYLIKTLGFQPQDIIVSGDSSGGNIAVALARYLIQANIPLLAVPRALFLMSPTADWACTHDNGSASSSMVRNSKSDAVGVILQCGYSANALLGSLPKSDLSTNAWLAPASLKIAQPKGLFCGMPPICMITGGAEQTLDPMITLRDRIIADNEEGIVEYLEYPDAAHVIDSWYEPERTQALKDLKRWLEKVL
jgi:acetyl esterase/lipase